MANPFINKGIFADRLQNTQPLNNSVSPMSLQQEQRQIFVRSYNDLVNALGRLIANYNSNTNINSYFGYEIIIADVIVVPSPIVLQAELSGLKITSLGAIPIFPSPNLYVQALFQIKNAKAITIQGLNCSNNPRTSSYFRNFVEIISGSIIDPLDGINILNNKAKTLRLYDDQIGTYHYPTIAYNSHSLPEGSDGALRSQSNYCIIVSNNFLGGDPIDLNGEYNKIAFNDFYAGDIFTSGSGTNVLIGNSNIGAGSSTGSDPLAPPFGGGGGAPTNATYVTLSNDATLTNERVLTAGTGISIVDGGAGSTITISASGGGGGLAEYEVMARDAWQMW